MAKKRDIEGKRLQNFELSEKNRTVRWILVGVLLAFGAVALIIGLISVLRTPDGWQTIENSSTNMNCGDDFHFQYELGAGELSATKESKALTLYYGQLTEKAWNLFYHEAGQTDVKGICYLNSHPNETVEVDPALYAALSVFQKSESRALYLGPVYSYYDHLLTEESDALAKDLDPAQNAEAAEEIAQRIAFTGDNQAVSLELLENNQVKLTVSQEYLQYAKDNDLHFLDFGWLKNAAAIDYMAQQLIDAGYTNGFLISVDGFLRNLDTRGTTYGLELYRSGQSGSQVTGLMQYSAPTAMAMLQAFRVDAARYRKFPDGKLVSTMIDPADGISKAAVDSLVAYGKQEGCLELALKLMPIYVSDTFSEDSLNAQTKDGVYSVWITEKEICYNQPNLPILSKDSGYTTTLITK